MKYIFVRYEYDFSAILADTINSRTETGILAAYTKLHEILKTRGLKPLLGILENECSTALK